MKLFKKALLATAIFGAMGAQAANVTDAVSKTSEQGFEVLGASTSSVRVIVRDQLEAGDLITLEFGDGFDTENATVDVDPDSTVDYDTDDTNDSVIEIIYGSGTYELSVHSSTDLAENKLVLEVETGDPITVDSSFEIVAGANLFVAAKIAQATVTYSATDMNGDIKDPGTDHTGSFVRLEDQYEVSVETGFNAVLNRLDEKAIVRNGGDAEGNNTGIVDSLTVSFEDNQTLLSAIDALDVDGAGTGTDKAVVTFTLEGDFSDYDTTATAGTEFAFFLASAPAAALTAATEDTTATSYSFSWESTVSELEDIIITMTGAAGDDEFNIGDYELSVDIDFGGADEFVGLDEADAGTILLDATLVNIPYFPVGVQELSTSVHMANDSGADVDVKITAFDQDGNEYEGELAPLAGKEASQVTKYSQTDIMDALEIDYDFANGEYPARKLSITFNIDAKDGDVKAYAFSNAGNARQALVTSQQDGKINP